MISPTAFFAPATKPQTGPGLSSAGSARRGVPADFDKCLAGASRKSGSEDDEKRARVAHMQHPRPAKRREAAPGTVPPGPVPTEVPTKQPPVAEPPTKHAPIVDEFPAVDDATATPEADDAEPTDGTDPAPVAEPPVSTSGWRPILKDTAPTTVIPPTQRTLAALAGESSQPPPAVDPSASKAADDSTGAGGQPGGTAGPVTGDAAKIAGPSLPADATAMMKAGIISSHYADFKQLTSNAQPGGTPIANGVAAVNATNPTFAKLADASTLLKRAAAVTSGAELSGHSEGGKPSDAPAAVLVGSAPTVDDPTPGTKVASASNAGAVVEHFTKIETLLQTVLHVGKALHPDGQGQMEMRLRLNGGAEDVTVRWQAAGDRLQVTFLTDSPGLRNALENGWKQLAAENTPSPVFAPALPGGSVPDQPTGGDFASFQQRSPSRDADPDTVPAPAGKFAPSTAAATVGSPLQTGRESGWRGWA